MSSRLGHAAADGDYLAAWPLMGACLLPLALVVGFLLGVTHFAYAPREALFLLASYPALALLILLSQHGAGIGLASLSGFVAGDLARTYFSPDHGGKLLAVLAAAALAAAVVWILLVATPLATRALSRTLVPTSTEGRPNVLRAAAVHGALQLVFVYFWCQVAPLLLQAAWIWRGVSSPPVDAMLAEARTSGWGLAILAAYAGAMRVVFETSAQASPAVRDRRLKRLAALAPATSNASAVRPLAGALIQGALFTFLLSSFFAKLQSALLAFGLLAAVLTFRQVALGHMGLGAQVRRVSLGLRLVIAVLAIIAASVVTAKLFAQSAGLGPPLYLIILAVGICAVLLPPPSSRAQKAAASSRVAAA